MKVGVYFQEYEPYHQYKDPGQIVLGLSEIGVTSELITFSKPSLREYTALPMRIISPDDSVSPEFWTTTDYDAVIAYTWLRTSHTPIARAIKSGGKIVIVKGDTDGRLNAPLHPMWDCFLGKDLGLTQRLKITRRRIIRHKNSRDIALGLRAHFESADMAVVETPQALANIAFLLKASGNEAFISKLTAIPNPVSSFATRFPLENKANRVVAVGNWEMKFGEYLVKNTKTMCRSIVKFLELRPDYEFFVFGSGSRLVSTLLGDAPMSLRDRLRISDNVPHEEVLRCLASSKIFFMPSISEGLSIAACEALSLGCSIVGSPLESLIYMSGGGAFGTIAPTFDVDSYVGSLLLDAQRWDQAEYAPQKNAEFWRNRLERTIVAGEFEKLVDRIS